MNHRVLKCVPYSLVMFVLMFLLASANTPNAAAQVNVQGKWTTLPYLMPINPVHEALMNNGKVLVVSGSGNDPSNTNLRATVWDPVAGTFNTQTLAWDMFCNGMVVLPDGRPFINGGTQQYDPFHGQTKSAVFDPVTNLFTDVQTMAHGRWYPTVTTLGDGRVMTFSGADENGATNKAVEIYTAGTGWSAQFVAPWTPPLYPRMHLLPNGKVFYSGSGTTSMLFDPAAHTWTTVATTIYSGTRTYGSSVLLPLTPANGYDPKVMILGGAGGATATATTEIIDLGAATPAWQSGPNMTQGRTEMNAVLLPTGNILAVGGSTKDEDATTKSLNADLFDPTVPSVTSAGVNAFARLYHSNAMLLPDATVAVTGGNPTRGTYEQHIEIYQPAYLFTAGGALATRPSITNLPSTISWNQAFSVTTPDAANISSVVLIRPGAPTHAFDMDQRMVVMSFTKGSGTLNVTAPPNGNIAPPGYYMLFLVNSAGVPSVAKFSKLGAAPAPTISSITPNSGTVNGGTSVTVTGANFVTGATVKLGTTSATGVTVVNSTTITATTPAHAAGAVNVVVTNTDAQSGTLTNGYTYSAANPAPNVTAINPTSGTTAGGTNVSITGTGFLAGATVKIGGTAATSVTVVGSTSITATTPAHAAGAASVVVTNSDAQSGTLANGYSFTSGTGGGTPGFVQVNSVTPQTTSGSVILGYLAAQSAGNLNVLAVGWNDTTSTVTSVTDTRGNTYTQAGSTITGSGLRQAIFYAKNIAAGTNTVTVSFNQAAAFVDLRILEYSGLDTNIPLDVTAGASGTSISPNSGAATTNAANELIFGAGMTGDGYASAGTGFTARIITAQDGDLAEDGVVTTAGSYSAAAPLKRSATWIMQMAAFRAAGQGGGNPAPTVTSINPTSGTANGGTAVTITGTGFLSGATVTLGGTAATGVTVASSTSITATTAAHAAGAVTVAVTNSDVRAAAKRMAIPTRRAIRRRR